MATPEYNQIRPIEDPLPSYTSVFGDPSDLLPVDAPPSEHCFSRTAQAGLTRNKNPWVNWRVFTQSSNVAPRAPKLPRFFGGDDVKGKVELRLESPQRIGSITIWLRGRLTTNFSATGPYCFFSHCHTVWSRHLGDPRNRMSSESPSTMRFEGKLSGDYDFDFEFPFPTEVDLTCIPNFPLQKNGDRLPPLILQTPQTFLERGVEADIQYELVLQVTHGGLFRTDTKLKTDVVYIPTTTPRAPSALRQLSYRESSPLMGPSQDPEGWITCPTVVVNGVYRQQTDVELRYTLSLADPLCYTRGTTIPCHLEISSPSASILSSIAHPENQRIHLFRRVTFFDNPTKGIEKFLAFSLKTGNYPDSFDIRNTESKSFTRCIVDEEEAEVANWWVASKVADVPSETANHWPIRRLEGEIHLARDLAPSTKFFMFNIEYFIQILPPKSSSFQHKPLPGLGHLAPPLDLEEQASSSSDPSEHVLQSTPISIATSFAIGPRPIAYSERKQPSMAQRERWVAKASEALQMTFGHTPYH